MVEHMSAPQTQQQSFDGGRPQRTSWHHQHRHRTDASAGAAAAAVAAAATGSPHNRQHRFSLFRWFVKRRDSTSSSDNQQRRRRSSHRHQLFRRHKRRGSSSSSTSSSSSSSVDTFYSTTTVRSFAFQSGLKGDTADALLRLRDSRSGDPAVGPFAPGAVKLVEKRRADGLLKRKVQANTCTLPTAFSQRQDIETRYSLHPVVNSAFISYDSIPVVGRGPRAFAEARRTGGNGSNLKEHRLNGGTLTSDSSLASGVRRVHVKGKRRAPDPPTIANVDVVRIHPAAGRRKRRPAPQPPGYVDTTTTPQSSNQNTLSSEASAAGMETLLTLKVTDCPIISNDTLVLRRGVLLSKKAVCGSSKSEPRTPATSVYADSESGTPVASSTASAQTQTKAVKLGSIMPRPWYKRNVFHESNSRDSTSNRRGGGDILRRLPSPVPPMDAKEDNASPASTSSSLSSSFPFEGSLSRLSFFHRSGDDKSKKESKRKSGLSILTNISELDKEAAAIVQEEQARNRASMILQAARLDEDFERRMGVSEDVVQEIVNSSMESSPRRSTRALISKFNALGGSSFFGRNSSASPKAKAKRFSQECESARREYERERDLSRYFLPLQSAPALKRESAAMFTEVVHSPKAPVIAEVKPLTTTTTTTTKPAESPKFDKSNAEFAKTLAAELDDVATGIAKLRRELDDRPKLMDQEKGKKETGSSPIVPKKPISSRDKDLLKFNREFTKIFDEIDRQLRSRDSRLSSSKSSSSDQPETSISNQVAKVLDILVNAEKDAEAAKSASPPPAAVANKSNNTSVDSTGSTASISNKEIGRTKRISGVDDKTTMELKEMLKEMKHSLPKRSRSKKSTERDEGAAVAPTGQTSRASGSGLAARPISTKVSSGVQTSGNVRKIVSDIAASNPVAVRPRERDSAGSTYQLIKDAEFAEMKRARPENTYANVQSTARVQPAVRIDPRGAEARASADVGRPRSERTRTRADHSLQAEGAGEEGEKVEEIKKQCMNTLAVNRLLRKLEAAIASGHHQQAAGLAKELAQLKIHCSVVRQRSCAIKQKLNLSMYIEDKQAHQGPIPLELPANMTLAQLKAKIQIEFEIPANVQRWIIGKNLADNDESSLEELQAVDGSPVFLYLVAPPDLQDKESVNKVKQENGERRNEDEQMEGAADVLNEKNDEQKLIHKIKAEIQPGPEPQIEPQPEQAAAAPEPVKEQTAVQQLKEEIELTKEEKLKRYEELMSLENCDVISNTEPIECPVCFMITIPNEGVILRDCLHSFCRLCVANTVRYCEEAEVKCPYRDADYICESTLQEREIKALVAPEVYQQHLAKSIAQAENNAGKNAFHCKTPDCPGWCIYDDNVNNFLCPVCKVNNCLTCQAVHMGKNCRQYQEELKYSKESDHESKRTAAMLEEMVERGEALPCPTCAVVLMKKWGCDWLRCSMCKTEICWVTRGPRWGPGGKGDTSGGCRCGENGVKCHPKCNYCH